jgi:hypothetical protein
MKIPAQIYEIFCPHCGCRIEYPLFMSSFYGFATYQEIKTQTIVRVVLEGVHHQKVTVNDLLKKYSEANFTNSESHKWVNLAETKFCLQCKKCFSSKEGKNARHCFEESIEVESIP